MKQYELLVVLPGTIDESEVTGRMKEIKAIVEKQDVKDLTVHERGKSRLAYPMKHIRYGYFTLIRFSAEGSAIPEIQKELGLMRDVLRALVSTYDPKKRAETQQKLGRTEDGTMKTLASVFERFGGEKQAETKDDTEESSEKKERIEEPKEHKAETPAPQEAAAATPADATYGEEPKSMEDIDKKLDQLLEDDLKTV